MAFSLASSADDLVVSLGTGSPGHQGHLVVSFGTRGLYCGIAEECQRAL